MPRTEQPLREDTMFGIDGEGVMRDKLTGARVFVMSRSGWSAFYSELDSTFVGSASVILQRFGYAYGKLLGSSAKALKLGTTQTFDALFELAEGAGWGSMALKGGDLADGIGSLRVKRCIFCEGLVDRKVDGCNFLPGVIRGVADEVTGVPHNVTETDCICKGSPSCEIQVILVGPTKNGP